MNRILYIFLMICLSGCSDVVEIPEVVNNEPVFKSAITVNGQTLTLVAGEGNYHNQPENQRSGDTLTLTSTFKNVDCDHNCLNSLTFSFKAENTYQPNRPFDELISSGAKPLLWSAVKDSQIVRVMRRSEGSAEMSYFEYGGQRYLANINNDAVAITIPRNEVVEVCLTDHSSKIGTSTQCQFFLEKREQPPRVKLKIKDVNEVRLVAEPIQPFDLSKAQFSWNTLTTGQEVTVSKDRLLANEVCVKVHYPDQRESQSCMAIKNSVGEFDLVSNFEAISFEEVKPTHAQRFGFVIVNFIDDNGKEFTTASFRQRPPSYFEVLSIEDFFDEISETRLKRLTVQFELELFARDGESLIIKSSETALAILPEA